MWLSDGTWRSGWWLDRILLKVFSNLGDAMILLAAHPRGSPVSRTTVTMSLPPLPSPEINNGVETTDELSLCSENGYANEMVTPTDHRDTRLRMN